MAAHTAYQIFVHVVWHTWRRVGCVDARAAEAVRQAVAAASGRFGVRVLACAVLADHVDLLITIRPSSCISDFVGRCKGLSSYLANRQVECALKWARGFYAASVSRSDLKAVKRSIAAQRGRHRDLVQAGSDGG
jgi:REP element-mobilizing transposase RayT